MGQGWMTETALCMTNKEQELPRRASVYCEVSLGNCQLRETRTHVSEAPVTYNSWA